MSQYGIVLLENYHPESFNVSGCIATPETWEFEKNGIKYGGFEAVEFAQDTINAILANGGEWFESLSEFQSWLNSSFSTGTININFPEGSVEVVSVPVDYLRTRVVCTIRVVPIEGDVYFKQFIADNNTIMPDGSGQYDYLFAAIDQGANFNDLVRVNLYDMYQKGKIFDTY